MRRGLGETSTRPQSRSCPSPPPSAPPALLPSPHRCGARAAVGSARWAAAGRRTLGLPICGWGRGCGGAVGNGLSRSIALGSIPSREPVGRQHGQAVPLAADAGTRSWLGARRPAGSGSCCHRARPGWPPVPAASGLPALCVRRLFPPGRLRHGRSAAVGRGRLEGGRGGRWGCGSRGERWREDGLCRQSSRTFITGDGKFLYVLINCLLLT